MQHASHTAYMLVRCERFAEAEELLKALLAHCLQGHAGASPEEELASQVLLSEVHVGLAQWEAAAQLLSKLLEPLTTHATHGCAEVLEVWGQLDTVVEKTVAGLTQCDGSKARLLQAYRSWCRG